MKEKKKIIRKTPKNSQKCEKWPKMKKMQIVQNPNFEILWSEWTHIELKSWLDRTSAIFCLYGGPLRAVVGRCMLITTSALRCEAKSRNMISGAAKRIPARLPGRQSILISTCASPPAWPIAALLWFVLVVSRKSLTCLLASWKQGSHKASKLHLSNLNISRRVQNI